jgi:aminopeptidase-like protein
MKRGDTGTMLDESLAVAGLKNPGVEMHRLISTLYPICRSITGNGFRESLRLLSQWIPIEMHEVASGTQVFDWVVPKEWNITDAYVKDSSGAKVIDFQQSNLHVVSYSIPVHRKMPLSELKQHLYTLPEHPDWIPYRTSYYKETWGFCASQRTLETLPEGEYEVSIDSSLEPGSLTYGEYYLRGAVEDEVLISCHCCHPSLCNDNLSGMALAVFLAKSLEGRPLHYSYRFLFIPVTIGSITWLSVNERQVSRIKHGLVVANVGDPGKMTYKKSRRGNSEIDRVVSRVLADSGQEYTINDFIPYGYDERQFSSPGFDLPVGCLTRTPYSQYPEYHTSADNLEFVQPGALANSLSVYQSIIDVLEGNKTYLNTNPKCEPQLGKRGLYSLMGGRQDTSQFEMALLWVLNYSDGSHTLLEIAERSAIRVDLIFEAADELVKHQLLREV